MECGSYRGIKLLELAMKGVKRIFEYRIWQQIEIDDMQFGFKKGKEPLVPFLPCHAMLARYMLSSCVCLSVHLSHAGIV